jgi:hypothetical protein
VIVVRHKYIAGRGKGSPGKLAAIGKALAHVKYIQHRPGEDREPGGRQMFNDREDDLDPSSMRKAIKKLGDSRVVVHKMTLAPEINPDDKVGFTREVMDKLGRDRGLDLEWFAVAHNNTEHHHIHVVVLGKDRNGSEVQINLKDIDKVKEWGDRYLERHHGLELERSRSEREERERERREERKREREAQKEERIREGLELPWMHRKIVREQLEPFSEWKERQDERGPWANEGERPYHQDSIEAAGRQWSKADNLKELRDLNEYLWDNYEERLPKDEYKKLVGWIRDKERLKDDDGEHRSDKNPKELEFQGEKYSKDDSYEKLNGLASRLREGKEKLPIDDYQQLRGWIEYKDRERFSGALESEIERAHFKAEHNRTQSDLKALEGGRVISPIQEELMRNPVVGLFMTTAGIAAEIVRSIPLDDRNRDYLKELRDELVDIKGGMEEDARIRMPWESSRNPDIEKLEKAIEEVEIKREEKRKREREERDRGRGDDWDKFDPWGRY